MPYKHVEVYETKEELGDGNESEIDGYDSNDDVNENIDDGNILVDEDNIFEEPNVKVTLFQMSKSCNHGNSSQISNDLLLENELDVIDNNDIESNYGYENDQEYVQKKKLRKYIKQKLCKAEALTKGTLFSMEKHLFLQKKSKTMYTCIQ
ncbi:hypothetical protein Tco_0900295 [Tanacetum coccineum]